MDKILITALNKVVANTLTVYHGSDNPNITKFEKNIDSSRFMLFKEFKIKSQGVFFSFDPEIAEKYGDYIYEVTIDNPKLFIREDDKNVGADRLDPKREKELAQMLLAIDDKEINLYEADISIPDDFDINKKVPGPDPSDNWGWIYYSLDDGIVWDVLDEPSFVKKLTKLGYDGTIAGESIEFGKRSLFISNLDKIKKVTLT